MIRFTFLKDKLGRNIGFECINHGLEIVCAAVSVLSMNTVNSIETFSDCEFSIELNEKPGFMEFILVRSVENNNEIDPVALLFLDSLELGIRKIAEEYGDDIEVFVKEVYDA